LYTYVHNNPLTHVDPTGHYCVSADGKYAHEGECDNGEGALTGSNQSVWKGFDEDWTGAPHIEDGTLKYYIGIAGPVLPEKMNYWSWEQEQIQQAKEAQRKVDEMYANTPDVQKPYLLQALLGVQMYPNDPEARMMLYRDIENKDISKWNKGSFDTNADSLVKHFIKHGKDVGATNPAQYYNKAEGFAQNLRGATTSRVEGTVEGVVRYKKLGKYIDLAPDGTIISFGITK